MISSIIPFHLADTLIELFVWFICTKFTYYYKNTGSPALMDKLLLGDFKI